jgi:hypothetical protein
MSWQRECQIEWLSLNFRAMTRKTYQAKTFISEYRLPVFDILIGNHAAVL